MTYRNEQISKDFYITRLDTWGILHARRCFGVKIFEKRYKQELGLKEMLGIAIFGLTKRGEPCLLINCNLVLGFDNIKKFYNVIKFRKLNQFKMLSNAEIGSKHFRDNLLLCINFFSDLSNFYKESDMYKFGEMVIKRDRGVVPESKKGNCGGCEEAKRIAAERAKRLANLQKARAARLANIAAKKQAALESEGGDE